MDEHEQEIERLRRQVADTRFADDLRAALSLAAVANVTASPVSRSRLLEMIVETAAHIISARGAALFLIDEAAGELVFEVALGEKADVVKRFRVPLGRGIAGLVAVSGQPMAISDAQSDPRQAADIAQAVSYRPQNLLCVPLFYNDQIIGVLELLDKNGAAHFTPEDMEALGLFANLSAVAIAQSRTQENLSALLLDSLADSQALNSAERERLERAAQSLTGRLTEDAAFGQRLELAQLVQEIAGQGEAEFAACRTLLRGFADYLRTRPTLGAS